MEKVAHNIYRIEVPLPGNPLKILNSYVIKGELRSLIIDTGFNTPLSEISLQQGLQELNIDLSQTDIFLTHLHADHSGLACKLKTKTNQVWISEPDAAILKRSIQDDYWDKMLVVQNLMGVPEDKRLMKEDHPGFAHRLENPEQLTVVKAGEEIEVGGYRFEVLDLKGHTPGHLGLWEQKHGILFSGDHVLSKITPNINYWDLKIDYLGAFLDNLKKLKILPMKIIFPAHRKIIDQPMERIDQLLAHHQERLARILELLSEKPSSMYEIAAGIPWDFGGGQFIDFPPTQQWFAVGEVYAHMEHLEAMGSVARSIRPDEVREYYLVD